MSDEVAGYIQQFLREQIILSDEMPRTEEFAPYIEGALDAAGEPMLVGISNVPAFCVQLEAYLAERHREAQDRLRAAIERADREMRESPGYAQRMQAMIQEGADILRGRYSREELAAMVNRPDASFGSLLNEQPPPEQPAHGQRFTIEQPLPSHTVAHPDAWDSQIGKEIPVHTPTGTVTGRVVGIEVKHDGRYAVALLITIELPPGVRLPGPPSAFGL